MGHLPGRRFAVQMMGGFDPASIATMHTWYSSTTGLTYDGGTLRTSSWAPKVSGSTNQDLAEVAAGQDPLYVAASANLNGRPSVRYDKTRPDQLYNSAGVWGTPITTPFSVFLVGRVAALDTDYPCPMGGNTGRVFFNTADAHVYWGAGADKDSGYALAAPAAFAIGAVFSTTDGAIYVNAKTAKVTGQNTGAGGINRLRVGNFFTNDPASDFDGELTDLMFFSGGLSAADFAPLLDWAGARYGISIGA